MYWNRKINSWHLLKSALLDLFRKQERKDPELFQFESTERRQWFRIRPSAVSPIMLRFGEDEVEVCDIGAAGLSFKNEHFSDGETRASRIDLPEPWNCRLPLAGYPQEPYPLLEVGLQFLHDQDPPKAGRKISDQTGGEGKYQPQVQDRSFRKGLPDIVIADPGVEEEGRASRQGDVMWVPLVSRMFNDLRQDKASMEEVTLVIEFYRQHYLFEKVSDATMMRDIEQLLENSRPENATE